MKPILGLLLLLGASFASAQVRIAEFLNPNAPYPSCHASTIVETTDHALVAAWFGGTHERNPDVGIWVARQEKGRWSEAVEVANGIQPSGPRLPTWNPVLFQAPKGPLFLFYKVGPKPSEWWGEVKRSEDGGRTWSKAERLPEGILGPVKNKTVILKDGTWMSPSSTEAKGWRVHLEVSKDEGKTWSLIGPIPQGLGFEAIQPSVLLHASGQLQVICRSKQGVLVDSWSSDQGATWSELRALGLPNPNSGTDAVTLADGRHLLVYNHSAPLIERPTKGLRYPIDVAISADGRNWTHVVTLDQEKRSAGYAYPAVIQTSDGLVHITYTWDRKMIKHVVLDPSAISACRDAQPSQKADNEKAD